MNLNRFLPLLFILTPFSCSKDPVNKEATYLVSAGKIIALTGSNWAIAEAQLSSKTGYHYSLVPEGQNQEVKAGVSLPATDSTNRAVNGTVLVNISPGNTITYAAFEVDSLTQMAAYDLMLGYNNASVQVLTGVSFSLGNRVKDGMGGNVAVDTIIADLTNGNEASALGIIYTSDQGEISMGINRQSDGSYEFSFSGRP